jgi:hypothetical protein
MRKVEQIAAKMLHPHRRTGCISIEPDKMPVGDGEWRWDPMGFFFEN